LAEVISFQSKQHGVNTAHLSNMSVQTTLMNQQTS